MNDRIEGEKFDAGRIRRLIATERFGRRIEFFETLDSTQRVALELAESGDPEGTLVVADRQTSGVGRRGRKWHSAAGLGLWFSMILRPRVPSASGGLLSAWAGLAALKVILRLEGVVGEAGLKWPNDVLVGGRKLSGILVDAASASGKMTYAVVGVGLNTGHAAEDFPEELASRATSVALVTGRRPDRAQILADLLLEMEKTYDLTVTPEGRRRLAGLAASASVLTGRRVRVLSGSTTMTGLVMGIDDGGGLILSAGPRGGEAVVLAGDVQLLDFEEDVS